jgi:endonuclease/exonuclease/phosphatase family metal-dependent hydrolase
MTELKITSFNIRVNVDKAPNDFDSRKTRIFEFINNEQPDIVGFQEVTDYMKACLREGMKGYTVVGCGREKNYRGEAMVVAFKTDKFEMLELKHFWLSFEPSRPGSKYEGFQSNCPRVTTAVLLKHVDVEKPIWFINTHLDHEGSTGRFLGAAQLVQFINELDAPCIMTGDFNAFPEDKEMILLKEKLTDCTSNIKGSFHSFRELTEEEMGKIDYVFTNLPAKNDEGILHDDVPVNGTFMSDHRPVSAFVKID